MCVVVTVWVLAAPRGVKAHPRCGHLPSNRGYICLGLLILAYVLLFIFYFINLYVCGCLWGPFWSWLQEIVSS